MYSKHGCRCEVCCLSNDEFNRQRREKRRAVVRTHTFKMRLDGSVLVDRLSQDGRLEGLNPNSIRRWMREGIELYNADEWCVRLGYHPVEIWGQDFYVGCHSE